MSETPTNLPPAGWYADPYGHPMTRWWDGTQWTQHTMPLPEQVVPAPVAATTPVAEPIAVSEPIRAQTVIEQPAQVEQVVEPVAERFLEQPTLVEPAYEQPSHQPASQQQQQQTSWQGNDYSAPNAVGYGQRTDEAPEASLASDNQAFAFFDSQPSSTPQAHVQSPTAPTAPTAPTGTEPSFGSSALDEFAFLTSQQPTNPWDDEEPPARNGAATAGLTFGILSLFIPIVPAILGIIFGFVGLSKARRLNTEGDGPVGRGKSVWALVLSILTVVGFTLASVFFLPGFLASQESSATTEEVSGLDALNERGNVDIQIGEVGELTAVSTGQPAVQFAITGIDQATACAADPAAVASGRFVALTMEFTTSADYVSIMSTGQPMALTAQDFSAFTFDGTAVSVAGAPETCVPAELALPASLPAGETVTGTIVLDVGGDVTAVSWGPLFAVGIVEQLTRWEWQLG